MKEDEILMCLICFVLGYLVARMMRGNGLMVGAESDQELDCCDTIKAVDNFEEFQEKILKKCAKQWINE